MHGPNNMSTPPPPAACPPSCAQTSDEAVFRQAATAVLARSAPPGAFSVPEPKALAEASITLEDFEGEAVRGFKKLVGRHVLN